MNSNRNLLWVGKLKNCSLVLGADGFHTRPHASFKLCLKGKHKSFFIKRQVKALFKPFVGSSINESLITLFFNYTLDIYRSDSKVLFLMLLFFKGVSRRNMPSILHIFTPFLAYGFTFVHCVYGNEGIRFISYRHFRT